MTIYRPELAPGNRIPMTISDPRHLAPQKGGYTLSGQALSDLGKKIGADAVLPTGSFADVMLQALDQVSEEQQFSSALAQKAITDPDSVDIHDITIAQAKASMSLNITRTVLNRLVQGWKDIINTR